MSRIFALAAFFSLSFSFGQNKNIDSLQVLLQNEKQEEKTIKTLLELSWEYHFVDAEIAREYGLRALTLSRKYNRIEYEVEALHNLGVTHESQSNYSKALDLELEALALRRKIGDDAKTANTLNNLGIIHDEMGDYKKALEYYYQARTIYEALKSEEKVAMVIVNIAIVQKAQGDYKQVTKSYFEALTIYTKTKNEFGIAVCYANLGSVYYYLKEYDSALYYSNLGTEEFQRQNIRKFLPTTLCNAGMAYDKLGQTEKAIDLLNQAKTLNREFNNRKELAFVLIYEAAIYKNKGDLITAENFANEALMIAQEIQALQQVMDARLERAEIKAKKGEFAAAYNEHRAYVLAKDSLFQKEKARQMAELQTEYETVKKENQILLLEQENEIKDSKLTQSMQAIVILLVVLTLILTLGYLWKNRMRLKQQAELQATRAALREAQLKAVIASQEEERKRFAADLHDGLGQMISALRLSLSKEKIEKPAVDHALGVLNDMNLEIRNIAFNLMPQVLVKSGLDEALKEFAARINRAGSVSVTVQTFNLNADMPDELRIALYRICQEWVNNVLKYGHANQIAIQIVQHPQELVLTIEDDGDGFELKALTSGQGNGWKNINSRLHMIKGSIEIDTIPGRKGTTLVATVPVSLAKAA
ncbi:MAG TPA: tetratricopeptide repeat protein [Cyclobacteriaceae bacterium]|jgi:two-component system NarL family sensor kinase|nr:tetratricopeptide repeat protein [Cytophagales bacterium]HRE67519.1 tetratricopeptide repeat protein [Cyclobacteriaceae bacterium]HRF33374.1 tetratricopeptide repeat protein [Cyclobacteriaceae bacterium]